MADIYTPRLKKHYEDVVRPKLIEKFGYTNPMQVPRIDKIVLNMGVGDAVGDSKLVKAPRLRTWPRSPVSARPSPRPASRLQPSSCVKAWISAPRSRCARRGCTSFLTVYINIALPRVRDFRGLSDQSFDGRGNYAMGLKEHIVFPEIDYDKIDRMWGMDIVICTTANTDEEARELLALFNFPFRKRQSQQQAA
jgi:large subunit ribosomal protein L5